jgi:hypothetical protein
MNLLVSFMPFITFVILIHLGFAEPRFASVPSLPVS